MVQATRFAAVDFDDDTIVPLAGFSVIDSLLTKLDYARSVDTRLAREAAERPDLAGKSRYLLLSMAAGGDFIEHVELLRTRATTRQLGELYASTTTGQALRGLSATRAAKFDDVLTDLLVAAWSRIGAPVDPIVDIDSTN